MADERKTLTLGDKPTEERSVRKEPEVRQTRPSDEQSRDTEVRPSAKKTRRKKTDAVDEFYVNPAEIPDGFTVEWKRYSTYGKDDVQHMIGLEQDGWEPANPKDFPSLVGKAYKGATIIMRDLMLMIRPKELTEEARMEDKLRANSQVRTKFEELGMSKPGEAPREDSSGRKLVKVSQSYERIPVGD